MKDDKHCSERTQAPAANGDDENHDDVIWGKSGREFAECFEQ